MHIEHVALWTGDIERLRTFYETWFNATAGTKYINKASGFQSCFLTFPSGPRFEIMSSRERRDRNPVSEPFSFGYAHIAFSAGSEEAVNLLTRGLQDAGHTVLDGPRRTGDGCYESVVLDPDGNRVEITI